MARKQAALNKPIEIERITKEKAKSIAEEIKKFKEEQKMKQVVQQKEFNKKPGCSMFGVATAPLLLGNTPGKKHYIRFWIKHNRKFKI